MLHISCSKQKVDIILKNAKVYTINNNFDIVDCIVIDKGKIIYVGNEKDAVKDFISDSVIDLNNKFVYPGFIDAHCHFYGYSGNLQYIQLHDTKSFCEIIELLKKHQKENPTEWIIGRGWNQNNWENKEFPDNTELDRLFPNNPVILTRIDGHAVIANSIAIAKAGITNKTVIKGGKIVLKNGKLTGIFLDNAADTIKKYIPEKDINLKISLLLQAQQNCFEVGLTTVADAGLPKKSILLLDSLQKEKKLKIRIYAMLEDSKENIDYFMKKGYYKTDFLDIRSIKLYSDGALGSRGARLTLPYSDDSDNYGLLINTPEYLKKTCELAYKYNYQVNTHAIGDSAVRLILNIYGDILKTNNDRRWRIEHSQVVDNKDIGLYKKYSIIPAINAIHATSDMYWAEERLGKERIKNAYAYKKLLNQNGWLSNGSDFPIENINPILGFYAAVSRKDTKGFPENGFLKENALSRKEAIQAITIWAAKACFEENEKGSIEEGKFADIVVTDKDLMQIPENEIPDVKILKTFVGGNIVYEQK